MDVADKIATAPRGANDRPNQPIHIKKILLSQAKSRATGSVRAGALSRQQRSPSASRDAADCPVRRSSFARRWRRSRSPLAGDVGRRRYFRFALPTTRTVIGVVYPAEEDDSRRRWIAARDRLRDAGARSRAARRRRPGGQPDRGGPRADDLAARRRGPGRARLARARGRCRGGDRRRCPIRASIRPSTRRSSGASSTSRARRSSISASARPLSPTSARRTTRGRTRSSREILAHPSALCHRDFHANNLFAAEDAVGVIDFQDLRRGPDSYDLASLLWERTTLDWMTEARRRPVIERFARGAGSDAGALSRTPAARPAPARLEGLRHLRAGGRPGTGGGLPALPAGRARPRPAPARNRAETALSRRSCRSPGRGLLS